MSYNTQSKPFLFGNHANTTTTTNSGWGFSKPFSSTNSTFGGTNANPTFSTPVNSTFGGSNANNANSTFGGANVNGTQTTPTVTPTNSTFGTPGNSTFGTNTNSTFGTPANSTFGTNVNSTNGIPANSTFGTNINSTNGTPVNSTFGTNINSTNGTPANSTFGTNVNSTSYNQNDINTLFNITNECKEIQLQILNEIKHSKNTMQTNTNVLHTGITCNGCFKHGITGIRYKCLLCKDFDFCEQCESSVSHNSYHVFIKIKNTEMFNTIINQNVPFCSI